MDSKKKKRKYYRKCPICQRRLEQTQMTRVNSIEFPGGWICKDCRDEIEQEEPDYDENEF